MRARPVEPQYDIDIGSLPSVLRRRAGVLAIAAAAVGSLTYGALLLVPSKYSSETQIRVGTAAAGDGGRGGAAIEAAGHLVDREAIASRVQELRSPDLAKRLASELKLNSRPEFNSALDGNTLLGRITRMTGFGGPRPGETEEERVLAAYYRALQVYQVKDTRVINLEFSANDGELAARAANRLIELYQDLLRQRGVTETSDTNAWLLPEIEKRTSELAAAEAEVERFRSTANLFRGGSSQSSGLAEQQISDLASELTRVRAQRSEVEARAQAARELAGRGVPDAIPDVQKSPVIQGLIAQRVRAERDLAEAATQLLPAHPRMKQLNAHVADIRRQVQREASTIVEGLEREVKALALREQLQQRTLDEAKSRLGRGAGDRVRLAQLEDDAKAKRRELDGLRERYESGRSRGTSKAVPVEIQVIATARPSSRPSSPNRVSIAALAAAATFVLGMVAIAFRELLSGGARRSSPRSKGSRLESEATVGQTVEPTLTTADGLPVQEVREPASVLGRSKTRQVEQVQPSAQEHQLQGAVSSVVERLLANSGGQDGYRSIVVGKDSTVDARHEATAIARSMSRSGRRVVLVDWSLDGQGISEGLGVASAPGFTELLTGTATFDDVIQTIPDGDVHLVPCGRAMAAGPGGLEANRLNLLLDALDEAYSDVVITGRHDAIRDLFLAIEGRVDAGVLVVREPGERDGTSKALAQRFLGFDVTEIDVMHLVIGGESVASAKSGMRRGMRSMSVKQPAASIG